MNTIKKYDEAFKSNSVLGIVFEAIFQEDSSRSWRSSINLVQIG